MVLLVAPHGGQQENTVGDSLARTCGAVSLLSTLTLLTTTASRRPTVSIRTSRFRPVRKLAQSKPCGLHTSVALTVWLSMALGLGVGSRPAWTRTAMPKASLRAA